MILIFIFLILVIIGAFFLNALILLGLCKLFKIQNASYWKLVLFSLIGGVANIIISHVLKIAGLSIFSYFIGAIVSYIVFAYLLKKYYQASWLKSLGVCLSLFVIGTLFSLLIAIPVRLFVFEPFVVSGASMAPHFNKGDFLVINKFDPEYKKDDVIVFKHPNNEAYLIKRIVGMPYQKVETKGGQIFVDNIVLNDSNIAAPINGDSSVLLGKDEYYVLGDNTALSQDSRIFGPVNKSQIVGKVAERI